MIKPALQGDAFLADVAAARTDDARPHLWWLGQSGYLVQFRGKHLLIDPYLSDSLTKKYAATDKPHVRMSEIVIDPRRLNFIDVVSSSHNHTDHLDGETLIALREANPRLKIVVPEANRVFAAERIQCDPGELIGMDDGTTQEVEGFVFHGVPAAHEQIERDEHGRLKYMGYVIALDRDEPPRSEDAAAQKGTRSFSLYHSGDTILFAGMADRLRPFAVDLALLPINGRAPQRRTAGNLWGRESARLAHDIRAKLVVPCHYDMFEFNTATPDEFVAECESLGQRYHVLRLGERIRL